VNVSFLATLLRVGSMLSGSEISMSNLSDNSSKPLCHRDNEDDHISQRPRDSNILQTHFASSRTGREWTRADETNVGSMEGIC
jgi:hypothetical protein